MKYNFYFNNNYFNIYNSLFPDSRSEEEVKFLTKFVPNKKARVLDLGCAWGRHLKVLAKLGYKDLTGVDYAEELLEKARINLKGYKVEFVNYDFVSFKFDKPFDYIFQLFQAFGHETIDYDKKNIQNAANNLVKGGIYLLDLRNPDKLLKMESFDLPSEIKIVPSLLNNGKRFKFTYFMKDKEEEIECNIYSRDELKNMFEEAGLRVTDVYGDYKGNKYTTDSERLILVGKKM
ncbi:MAG TPA: class I SAM-dependent methyltransferase [Patescibacteria group bacterium]|nr:class I SAM-dependent methyltransferase [Patescibacteria group bacterium]